MRRLALVAATLAVGAACSLNPQPLPPSPSFEGASPDAGGGFKADAGLAGADAPNPSDSGSTAADSTTAPAPPSDASPGSDSAESSDAAREGGADDAEEREGDAGADSTELEGSADAALEGAED
jgi:hypothetical protein